MRNIKEQQKFIKFINSITNFLYEIDDAQDLANEIIDGDLGGESYKEKIEFLLDVLDEYFEWGCEEDEREYE